MPNERSSKWFNLLAVLASFVLLGEVAIDGSKAGRSEKAVCGSAPRHNRRDKASIESSVQLHLNSQGRHKTPIISNPTSAVLSSMQDSIFNCATAGFNKYSCEK